MTNRALDKNGKPIREQWVHATVWIVGPVVSAMLSYGIGLILYRMIETILR